MKTFIVLGMHRSATSLVSKGIHLAGVEMFQLNKAISRRSPHGIWEDKNIFTLNKNILEKAGGSWYDPPEESDIIEAGKQFAPKIKSIVKRRNALGKNWGWKEPRTTLTIKCYTPYLENPHYIACFRDPVEVAKSLNKRNGFSMEKGIELTRTYNQRLMEFLKWTYL